MTRTIFRGGAVFDGTGAPAAVADVAVVGGRFVDAGPVTGEDDIVDMTGKTLLPGLFDCHVHVCSSGLDIATRLERPFSYQFYAAAKNLARMLDIGITSARDAGGADLGMKRAIEDGLLDGPRLKIAVSMLSQTGGHGDGWRASGYTFKYQGPHPGRPDALVDSPEEMRRKVRELIRAGADVIKVCTTGGILSARDHPDHRQFSEAEIEALADTAFASGTPFMAHAQSPAGVQLAVRGGARSIEHGVRLDDESIDLMLERGTWLVPTLISSRAIPELAARGVKLAPHVVEKAKQAAEVHQASFARAHAAGVKIAMGTDTGVTDFGDNLGELTLMVEGGMSPEQALHATTESAAELLGYDDLGRIIPGYRADMVVVDGGISDLTTLPERIVSVYKDGELVRGDAGTKGKP